MASLQIIQTSFGVFGALAFAHIKQDKLEARAIRCAFIGYPHGIKGYKLWRMEPGEPKCLISRDVVFDESRMASRDKNQNQQVKSSDDTQIEVELLPNQRSNEAVQPNEAVDDHSGQNTENDYNLVRDRARRVIVPPERFGYAELIHYALTVADELQESEPSNYKEAMSSTRNKEWLEAMTEELRSLEKNRTWILVDPPKNQKIIGCKWIYKRKEGIPGIENARFKARLVAKGFTQVEGVDFHEIFSPVVKHCSIRILLSIVTQFDLNLEQLDVKTAFLHGDLEETIYMHQPEGFVEDRSKVCLLKKSLYGLKQSPRQWYKRFDDFLMNLSFQRCSYDSCVYTLRKHGELILYLLLYVDDILIACSSNEELDNLKARLNAEFEMKNLGEAKRILGMDIIRNRSRGELFLSQEGYMKKVVRRFRMHEAKPVTTPLGQHDKLSKQQGPQSEEGRAEMASVPYASGVGSIMYGMVCSRPDLAHAVSVISRFMADPGQPHWKALKWTLRYLNGTLANGLKFKRAQQGEVAVKGYVDSDYAGNIDTRKSLTGYVFTLYGTAVSWKSVLQSVVALSTTQAEYIALAEAVKEAMWFRGIIDELGITQDSITIYCDSQSAIHLSKHQVYHERSKHIDVRLHFIRDVIESKEVKVEKIASEENPADALTKSLPFGKFKHCLDLIGFEEK